MKITLYTISDCLFSKQERDYLALHDLSYEEKNLETSKDFLAEMLAVSNNFAGTPVTKIEKDDGQIVVLKGFTQTEFDKTLGFPVPTPTSELNANLNIPPAKPQEPQTPAPTPPPEPQSPPEAPPIPPTPSPVVPDQPPVSQPNNGPTNPVPPIDQPLNSPPPANDPLNSVLNNLKTQSEAAQNSPNVPSVPPFEG